MKNLYPGSTGPWVELVQSILKKYGFYFGETDGIFGPLTGNAVIEFQIKSGLNPDGIVGANVWSYLMPWINGYIVHTIKTGDTFYSLARYYSSEVGLIIAANPDADPDNLQTGQKVIIPFSGSFIPDDISYTFPIMQMNINALKVRFPFLEISSIGKSVLGNDLTVIKFGNGEKEVMYNASHHANEWITSVVLMKYIEDICLSYVRGENIYGYSAEDIFGSCSIYFIPMVNPDGVNLVTGELTPMSGAYQYARNITDPSLIFPDVWAANIRGVDLNSNYPALWEQAREVKFSLGYTRPGPVEYVGESPLSEPESRAMVNFTREHNFRLTLSYHTQGEVIFYRFSDFDPPQATEIAQRLSEASGYILTEPNPESLYAGYKDWFIQEYNRPGYTIECGVGTNPLPISQFDEIYNDNIGILTLGAVL